MASVRKQKPTMEPSMPTKGRIHILKAWREQSLTLTVSVVSGRRSSDVGTRLVTTVFSISRLANRV